MVNNTVRVPTRFNYIDHHMPRNARTFIAQSYNGIIHGKNQTKSGSRD